MTMRKKYSHARPQPIGEILSAAFKKRGMAVQIEQNAASKLWSKAVGPKIAAQTRPDILRAGTLFVRTTSSVWVQQLHFMKDDIRQKLNTLAGKTIVRDIHFTIGYTPPSPAAAANPGDAPKPALRERDRRMISECTQSLADQELAALVRRVMKLEISRRRLLEKQPKSRSK